MSDKIRGRPAGAVPSDAVPETATPKAEKKVGRPAASKASSPAATAASEDLFVRSPGVGAQLENRLQPLAGKTQAGKFVFNDKDIEYLANTFAAILGENPQADRLKRARLFAAAILKRKRLKKVFAGLSENEMEQMCDIIGDVIDSSPVFGQLVDNVTEGAGKSGG